MNCNICFEDNIQSKDMHYMECLHNLCDICYKKLEISTCPFCRQEISLSDKQISNQNFSEDNEILFDITFEVDFIIPTIRRNRQEYKRNKRNRKKEILNSNVEQYYQLSEEKRKLKHPRRKYTQ